MTKASASVSRRTKKKTVGFTELVLRDGHQSLLATRMKLEDMLPICNVLDRSGYASLEVWGGATFDSCVRFLREDPWARLRELRQALPNSRLQMLLRGQNLLGYRHYADDVVDTFVRRAANNGMDVFRIFDAMNDFDNVRTAIAAVVRAKKHAQGTICYTTSPVHSVEVFVALAEQLADAGCHSLAIKDMAGIMTPTACEALVRGIKRAVGLPLHLHSHATSGLAAHCYLRGVQAGADVVDTVISPFAEGASHPATETMQIALRDLGYDSGLKADALESLADYFRHTRQKYWQFESEFTGFNPSVLSHHVPGGMISNLTSQLQEQGALDRLGEVLLEIPKVREDLGYPPLVTPTSQIVAVQATLNVMSGKRYGAISQEVKNYLAGAYGRIPGAVNWKLFGKKGAAKPVAPAAKRKAKKARRAKNIEMERLTNEVGGLAKNEDDVLIYAMFPDLGKQFLQERAAGTLRPLQLAARKTTADEGDAESQSSAYRVTVHGETYNIRLTGSGDKASERRPMFFTIDGVSEEALVEVVDETAGDGKLARARQLGDERPQASAPGHVATNMSGRVVSVAVKGGQSVKAGDTVVVIESMKMENEVHAPIAGKVVAVLVSPGDAVKAGELLIEIAS